MCCKIGILVFFSVLNVLRLVEIHTLLLIVADAVGRNKIYSFIDMDK
jgi:hypothetical protein